MQTTLPYDRLNFGMERVITAGRWCYGAQGGFGQLISVRQLHCTFVGRARMKAYEDQGLRFADLDLVGETARERERAPILRE